MPPRAPRGRARGTTLREWARLAGARRVRQQRAVKCQGLIAGVFKAWFARAGSASGEAAPLIKAPSNGTWSPKPVLLAVVALAFVALTSGGGPATRLRSLRGPGKETSAETATLALSGQLPHCNSRVKPDGIAPGTIVGNCQQDGYPASSCQFYGTTDGDPTTDPCKELRCGKNRWYVCNADGPDDFCISYDVKGYCCRVDIPWDGLRRRRGCDVDVPRTSRGDAAAATWTFRGDGSRRRHGCDVDIRSRPAHASGTITNPGGRATGLLAYATVPAVSIARRGTGTTHSARRAPKSRLAFPSTPRPARETVSPDRDARDCQPRPLRERLPEPARDVLWYSGVTPATTVRACVKSTNLRGPLHAGYTFDGNVCKYSRDNCENGIINPEGQKKGCYCCTPGRTELDRRSRWGGIVRGAHGSETMRIVRGAEAVRVTIFPFPHRRRHRQLQKKKQGRRGVLRHLHPQRWPLSHNLLRPRPAERQMLAVGRPRPSPPRTRPRAHVLTPSSPPSQKPGRVRKYDRA